ncbi:MAG: hypothetical protein WEF86_00595 [Gemmatimonadota bacterium]
MTRFPAAARTRPLLACVAAVLVAAGCEESFAPIAPSDLQFSAFGYLDASADTQWIRVMPIRPLMVTSPDSFDTTVTLEHLGTGAVIVLRDSVFRYLHHQHPELGSDGVYLHNFWTTQPIEPGASYRFSAVRDGGAPAEAIVDIPADYDVEVWIETTPQAGGDVLRLSGLKHVAFVTLRATFHDRCGAGATSRTFRPPAADGGVHMIPLMRPSIEPRPGCGPPVLADHELSIVGAETAWPSGDEYDPSRLGQIEEASNITNSLGFLGGGLTRVVPYETCSFQGGGPIPSHCRLRYDAGSAVLKTTVEETRCGNGALDSTMVQLREIDGEPTTRKVRTVMTNREGEARIAALEPGVRYSLFVRAKPIPDPFWGEIESHSLHTDTVTFSPGEQRSYDVELEQINPCGSAQ